MQTQTLFPDDRTVSSPSLPRGWRLGQLENMPCAFDTEDLVHVELDGEWYLYVPWFTNPGDCPVLKNSKGDRIIGHIDQKGVIRTPGGRFVKPQNWHH